jgi:uroporphyrinogen-III synthase
VRRVLVTRSEPGASETAQRLSVLGHVPIVEPLFRIDPIDVALPAFDALAFTSANGVRIFAKLSKRRDVPVFCVGGRTAGEARELGFGQVQSAEGDVKDLIALIAGSLPPGTRLLHSGNEGSLGDLASALTARGLAATHVATFRAAPVEAPPPKLAAQIAGRQSFEAVLIHSPRAAAILGHFLKPGHAPFGVAAISANAAAELAGFGGRMEIAARPDEEALLAALAKLSA